MPKVRLPLAPNFHVKRLHYKTPELYEKQRKAIFECVDPDGMPARYALIEASTKSGKTVGCLAWLLEQAILQGKVGRIFLWVAPVYAQAEIAFRRLKLMLLPHLRQVNESTMTITLPNGAMLRFRSAEKPDNLYGEDVYAAVIDEASRMRKEAWHAVRSTLTKTEGKVRIIGNVKGRRNWFYLMAREAEMGKPGMAYAKITAADAVDAGVLSNDEIEDARSKLPEQVFQELYNAEASDDGGNPFGLSHIDACTMVGISEGKPIACGVDLAKHLNYSVIVGLDREGNCCGFERFQSSWADTKRRVLDAVQWVPTLIDSTGVGDAIYEDLAAQRSSIEPFLFTTQSKQKLLENLAAAIQQRQVKFPDGPLRQELEIFEYEVTRTHVRYAAPEGYHDDCVMALALAWEMYRRRRPIYDFRLPPEQESPEE
nr:terminase family protein [Nitrosomonas nitrosa]